MHKMSQVNSRYNLLLWTCSLLFAFRVFAQMLVANYEVEILPSFERWHSGTMPYSILLLIQLVILAIMLRSSFLNSTGRLMTKPTLGKSLLILGVVYFIVMLIRLGLGLTIYTDSRWFSNHVPTFFHLVLAIWVISIGRVYSANKRYPNG